MDAVAIGADGGLLRTVGDRPAVHALLIGDEWLGAFAVRLHEEPLPVAAAAGGGNVGVTHRRLGIVAGHELVDVAVAVLAGCGDFATAGYSGVNTVRVALPLVCMALGAGDFLRSGFVRETTNVGVAVDALEHGAVNGMLELVLIDVDAHRRAVYVLSESGIGVAGEAVRILELLRGVRGGGPGKTEKNECKRRKPASKVHALRRRFGENCRRDRSHRGSYQPSAISLQMFWWRGGGGAIRSFPRRNYGKDRAFLHPAWVF